MTEQENPLLTIPEAARVLDVPERTLRRWVAKGVLNSEADPTDERRRLITTEALEAFRVSRNLMDGPRPASATSAATPDMAGGQVADDDRPSAATNGQQRPSAASAGQVAAEVERAALEAKVTQLEARLADRDAQLADKDRQITWLQEHAGELLHQLDQERQDRRALEARRVFALPAPEPSPVTAAPAAHEAAEGEGVGPDDAAAPRRPWWRFWET